MHGSEVGESGSTGLPYPYSATYSRDIVSVPIGSISISDVAPVPRQVIVTVSGLSETERRVTTRP